MREKELEDLICEAPWCLDDDLVILGRQIKLPNGRMDVLAWDKAQEELCAIELKVTKLKEADLGQVMRYRTDLIHVLRGTLGWPTCERDADLAWSDEYAFSEFVQPVLVGPAIDNNLLASMQGLSMSVYLYSITPDNYIEFNVVPYKLTGHDHRPFSAQPWAAKSLRLVQGACSNRRNDEYVPFVEAFEEGRIE